MKKLKFLNFNFHNHILSYIIAPIIVVVGVVSYYRFMIKHDYIVGYEGECDAATEQCFIGCEDEECTKEYYFTEMKKYAADLYRQCGNSIVDCEEANKCLPEDSECSISYCNPESDDSCETLTEKSFNEQVSENTQEDNLQNNFDLNI